MSTTILGIGFMVFVSHFLSLLFRKTNIPDVLILMSIGLLLGPVLGWVHMDDFGKVGPIIATIALVVILFESGTSLQLGVMGRALGRASELAIGCLLLTVLVVALGGYFFLGLAPLPALLLGIILGGTSSAVVIPMVGSLGMGEKTGTVLVLESALTDVLCIVGVFALLQVLTEGNVDPGKLIAGVFASLLLAALLGVLGGVGWLMILGKVREFPNTISATVAYAFLVYGTAEFFGFSGAVAVMALGITLTRHEQMGLQRLKLLREDVEALTSTDLAFYGEAVFLLKTYFFIYLGISIRFNGPVLVGIAAAMICVVFVLRALIARFIFRPAEFALRDTALASMLAPKGLAAAVLAAIPLQRGIAGGEMIRDATYMAVLVSILLCAALVATYPPRPVRGLYSLLLGKRE
jgi:NhaP-type Na+/H+ or K+/H+ antiporter